jgi:hypothetical protein
LTQNHLGGSIPTDLGMLTKLKMLDLGVNNLIGTVPSILGQPHFTRFIKQQYTWKDTSRNWQPDKLDISRTR